MRLTPSAYAHGLALALPGKREMARPTAVGRAISTYTRVIPATHRGPSMGSCDQARYITLGGERSAIVESVAEDDDARF